MVDEIKSNESCFGLSRGKTFKLFYIPAAHTNIRIIIIYIDFTHANI